jgi:hypothetical protein
MLGFLGCRFVVGCLLVLDCPKLLEATNTACAVDLCELDFAPPSSNGNEDLPHPDTWSRDGQSDHRHLVEIEAFPLGVGVTAGAVSPFSTDLPFPFQNKELAGQMPPGGPGDNQGDQPGGGLNDPIADPPMGHAPEPASVVTALLGAAVLGAVQLRRRRATCNSPISRDDTFGLWHRHRSGCRSTPL